MRAGPELWLTPKSQNVLEQIPAEKVNTGQNGFIHLYLRLHASKGARYLPTTILNIATSLFMTHFFSSCRLNDHKIQRRGKTVVSRDFATATNLLCDNLFENVIQFLFRAMLTAWLSGKIGLSASGSIIDLVGRKKRRSNFSIMMGCIAMKFDTDIDDPRGEENCWLKWSPLFLNTVRFASFHLWNVPVKIGWESEQRINLVQTFMIPTGWISACQNSKSLPSKTSLNLFNEVRHNDTFMAPWWVGFFLVLPLLSATLMLTKCHRLSWH